MFQGQTFEEIMQSKRDRVFGALGVRDVVKEAQHICEVHDRLKEAELMARQQKFKLQRRVSELEKETTKQKEQIKWLSERACY